MVLNIVFLSGIIFLVLIIDLPGIWKMPTKKRRKTLIAYSILLLLGFSLGLFLILDFAPVSLATLMAKILTLLVGIEG